MKTDEIRLLYTYNDWANQRILTTCATVTPEQYVANAGFGSLRAALVHTLDAERTWRFLFLGQAEPDEIKETDLPTLSALEERWRAEQQEMWAFINGLSDAQLDGVIRYPLPSGTIRERVLWHCLLHVVNHGTQHRSEAAALLTSYGQSPGDLDMTVFMNEHFNLPS